MLPIFPYWRIINLDFPPLVTGDTIPLNDVTIVTEKDIQDIQNIQNESKVQTVNSYVDTRLLLLTVGPQVYNMILEYSNIYAELFSFGLVFERQILHYVSVTVIAPNWVSHWIYKYSRRYTSFYRSHAVCSLDFRSMYPSIMPPYNADFDGDEPLDRIINPFAGSDRYKETRMPHWTFQELVCLVDSPEGSDKVGLNKQWGFSCSENYETVQPLQRKLNREKVIYHQKAQDGKVERTHTRHENKRKMRVPKQKR